MRLSTDIHTLGQNFQVFVRTDTEDHMERALSLAFNDRIASYVAVTQAFGLIFLRRLETDKELEALTHPVSFDIEPHTMSRAAETESYRIIKLKNDLSVGPAIRYVKEWLDNLSEDQFHLIAGVKQTNWDLATWPGVEISTGTFLGHIGMHTDTICYVKPAWLLSSRGV